MMGAHRQRSKRRWEDGRKNSRPILGSSLGGVEPVRGLRGEEEGGGVRSRPGAARTILFFHIISARPLNSLFFFSHAA